MDDFRVAAEPAAIGQVVYNNRFYRAANGNGVIALGATNTIGAAIVQNLIEGTNATGALGISCFPDSNTNPAVQILLFCNTVVGKRINYCYNDAGVNENVRQYFGFSQNFIEDYNIKSDLFTGAGGPSGARIGNWATMHGAMQRGNILNQLAPGIGFANLGNENPGGIKGLLTIDGINSTNWMKFQSRKAYDAVSALQGSGDYRLQSSSPMFGISGSHLISHDIDGVPRGMIDAPGAFSSGNAKKGAFF